MQYNDVVQELIDSDALQKYAITDTGTREMLPKLQGLTREDLFPGGYEDAHMAGWSVVAAQFPARRSRDLSGHQNARGQFLARHHAPQRGRLFKRQILVQDGKNGSVARCHFRSC